MMRDKKLEHEIFCQLGKSKNISSIQVYEELESTNKYALELARDGAKSGTIIIAKKQTKAYGRSKRLWHTNNGDLALSLIIRPPLKFSNLSLLPFLPALAIVDAVKNMGASICCKWPNDLVYEAPNKSASLPYFAHFRKLGGILVENIFAQNIISASVVGLGLNINYDKKLVSQVPHAGFLSCLSPNLNYANICVQIIKKLNFYFFTQEQNMENKLLNKYTRLCVTLGRDVLVKQSDKIISGRASKILANGALVIKNGLEQHILHAGEVNLKS